MDKGFWEKLNKPVIGLAPMDGVTDAAFRYITAKYGKPDLIITEFTSVEGICAGALKTLEAFIYDEIERPAIAQIFGSTPEAFYKAAFVIAELGFDGIDINMGCPAKNIASRGSGAGLIRTPILAKEIIRKTKFAINDWVNGKEIETVGLPEAIIAYTKARKITQLRKNYREILPVSIKTRIGFDSIVIEEWVKHLIEEKPANISIHGRTLKQMYSGASDWEAIAKAAQLIHQTSATILGNGDIKDLDDAKVKIKQYGVDGVLIGRAALGNPWVFQKHSAIIEEKFAITLEHARYYEKVFSNNLFLPMRKHLSWYCRGFAKASQIRQQLMRTKNSLEVEDILSFD